MAVVEKIGTPFVINSTTAGIQFSVSVSTLRNGGFVVAWTDFDSGSADDPNSASVRAQIYNDQGLRVGAEFRVNSQTTLSQSSPDIATLDDGSFVIIWTHEFSATDLDVRGQRFSEGGVPIGGEFGIATTGTFDEFGPQITAQTGGRYLVVWGQDDNIVNFVQKNADGTTVSGPGPVDPGPHGVESSPSITALVNGTYVTAFVEDGEIIQRQLVGGAPGTQVNTTTFNPQRSPTIEALEGGGYVVVWVDDAGSPNTPFVLGQRYNAAGAKVGGEFVVNPGPESIDFTTPKVAPLIGGGFLVLFDDRNQGLRAQAFDENGVKFGGIIQITPPGVAGSFGDADLDVMMNGDVIVTWGGLDGVNNAGVEGQILRVANIETGGAGNDTLFGAFSALKPGAQASDILRGLGGDDVLHGGGGAADELDGGTGNDTASYEGAPGAVTADLQIPAFNNGDAIGDSYISIENLTGSFFNDQLFGNAGANILDGSGGADFMEGRGGNDTYVVDVAGDVTVEAANGGIDTVQSSVTRVLGANLERLVLTGGNNINGTGNDFNNFIAGNAAANTLSGLVGNDTLQGNDGNDTLIGGLGADSLSGGVGTDFASYQNAAAGVRAHLGAPNTNTGDAAGDTYASIEGLVGSNFNDILLGNTAANTIKGGAGNDAMNGFEGSDTLFGQAGNDRFIFTAAAHTPAGVNRDVIGDFEDFGDNDTIDLSGFPGNLSFIGGAAFSAAGQVRAIQQGAHVLVQINTVGVTAAEAEILLVNTALATVNGSDFLL